MQSRTKGLIIALCLAGAIAVAVSADAVCDAHDPIAAAVVETLIKCRLDLPT